jgi:hypothetical protein
MTYTPKALTVAQLITELQKMPVGARVNTEGCDCNGEAGSVILDKYGDVLITRPEGESSYLGSPDGAK